MKILQLFPTSGSLLVLCATGCADASPATPAQGLETPELVHLEDRNGARIDVTLLAGSSLSAGGDAHYAILAQHRKLAVERTVATDGPQYVEVTEADLLLAAAEFGQAATTLRGPDGSSVRSESDVAAFEQALVMIDPLALVLLDKRSLELFDAVLAAPSAAPDAEHDKSGLLLKYKNRR